MPAARVPGFCTGWKRGQKAPAPTVRRPPCCCSCRCTQDGNSAASGRRPLGGCGRRSPAVRPPRLGVRRCRWGTPCLRLDRRPTPPMRHHHRRRPHTPMSPPQRPPQRHHTAPRHGPPLAGGFSMQRNRGAAFNRGGPPNRKTGRSTAARFQSAHARARDTRAQGKRNENPRSERILLPMHRRIASRSRSWIRLVYGGDGEGTGEGDGEGSVASEGCGQAFDSCGIRCAAGRGFDGGGCAWGDGEGVGLLGGVCGG